MKPETRLMGAIFGEKSTGLDDKDYYENIQGLSLRQTLENLLDDITNQSSRPMFAKRVKALMLNRFGFDTEPKSLKELGRMFDVTPERIRQHETTALRMLRHPIRSRHLKKYLNELAPDVKGVKRSSKYDGKTEVHQEGIFTARERYTG